MSASSILLKQVKILDPGSVHHLSTADVLVSGGKIQQIRTDISIQADKVIQRPDVCISQGWFDMRMHIGDPGIEHKEDIPSGLKAAARGGFTGVGLLPATRPVVQSKDTLAYLLSKSEPFTTQVHPYAAVTTDLKGEEMAELMDLFMHGAAAFTDAERPISHVGVLSKALQYASSFEALLIQRPDEPKLSMYGQMHEGRISAMLGLKGIPSVSEEMIIQRDLMALRYFGGKIHFSKISTSGSLELIRMAKKEGLQVTCDVAIANLCFTDEALLGFDTYYKVCPPLRDEGTRLSLWQAVADGTIDVVVSDHQPQDIESKRLEFDQAEFGMSTVETFYSLLTMHKPAHIPLESILPAFTSRPRSILSLSATGIQEGATANLTLFCPTAPWIYTPAKAFSKAVNSPLWDQTLQGSVLGVVYENKSDFFE